MTPSRSSRRPLTLLLAALIVLVTTVLAWFFWPESQQPLLRDLPGSISVARFLIAPDNRSVLVLANTNAGPTTALYQVPLASRDAPVLLSAEPARGRSIDANSLVFSADGRYAVYTVADSSETGARELWSALLGKEQPTKIAAALPDTTGIADVAVAPSGNTVVYLAGADGVPGVFRASLSGGASVRLAHSLAGAEPLQQIQISPDGRWAVVESAGGALFSVSIDEEQAATLATPNRGSQPVREVMFSADSSQVLFLDDAANDGVYEAWSASPAGDKLTRLNAPLDEGEQVYDMQLWPDGNGLIYTTTAPERSNNKLYSMAFGGQPVLLDNGVQTAHVSADSRRAIYTTQSADGSIAVRSTPLDRANPSEFGPLPPDSSLIATVPLPSGEDVLFALASGTAAPEWYRAAPSAAPTKLGGPGLLPNITPDAYALQGDATTLFYIDNTGRVVALPLNGGDPTVLSAGDAATQLALSDDGRTVVWLAAPPSGEGRYELFARSAR